MTKDDLAKLSERLCQYTGRKYCILSGRAATLIHAYLVSKHPAKGKDGTKKRKVIVPSVVCPALPNAVLYSGYDPIFCDISKDDFNMDLGSVKNVLASEKDVDGIIPVHLYGYPAQMDAILKLAKEHGLFVLEDAAQAQGALYNNKLVGSFGDASVISFGHTKVLDVGCGGALLLDDKALAAKVQKQISKVTASEKDFASQYEIYRKTYYSIKALSEIDPKLEQLYVQMPHIFKDLYFFKTSNEQARLIDAMMDKLDDILKAHRAAAKLYRKYLVHKDIVHPAYSDKNLSAYWRYSFIIKRDDVKTVTEALRTHKVDVSNWYPPLHRWYHSGLSQPEGLFKGARYVGAHVMNLWTWPSIDEKKVASDSEHLLNILDGKDDKVK
jgi:dTDP-4-amino-4,6-dideoxygalactose transaminase